MDDLYSPLDPESDAMDVEEPEWMTNNRQWYAGHREVSWMKFSPSTLEGWVMTDPVPSFPAPDVDEESLDIDLLFSTRPRPPPPEKTFMTAMDVTEAPDLDRMGVGRLFNDEDFGTAKSTSSSVDSRRKYWTKEEESVLSEFLSHYSPHCRVPKSAWVELSRSMNRSQCSITAKAAQIRRFGLNRNPGLCPETDLHPRKFTLEDMILVALSHLPSNQGTKVQIVEKIQEMFGDQLSESQTRSKAQTGTKWKNSVKQILSAAFVKVPGRYQLNEDSPHLPLEKCSTMQDFILWALQDGSSSLQDIKQRIKETFGRWLNETVNPDSSLCVWEKTLLKKLKSCPYIDHSQAATKFRLLRAR